MIKRLISILIILVYMFNIVFASESFTWAILTWNMVEYDEETGEKILLDWEEEENEVADVMTTFKEKKQAIINQIYANTNLASLMDFNNAAKQLEDITFQLDTIGKNYTMIREQKKWVDVKYKELFVEMEILIKRLEISGKKLKDKLIKIQLSLRDIEKWKKEINILKQDILVSKLELSKYISLLYKTNNDFYNADSQIDNIKLFLKSSNIAHSISQEDVLKLLGVKTQDLLSKLDIQAIKERKSVQALLYKKRKYMYDVEDYKTDLEIMTEKKENLSEVIDLIKNNKIDIDKAYTKLRYEKRLLRTQQKQLVGNLTTDLEETFLNTTWLDLTDLIRYADKNDGWKFLSWPTTNFSRISAFYQDENYMEQFGAEHDALDIAMPQWTEVYSPAVAYVYMVVDNESDYYNWAILIHNYGYITVYGHMNRIIVKEWEIIQRGQIIGLSWWKKWTRWAWKLSTWPHLHFEVIKNGQRLDPLSVLDTSILIKEKEKLDRGMKVKMIKDALTRNIPIDGIKIAKGTTLDARRQYVLDTRATSSYRDLSKWKSVANRTGIDVDVGICIWYSESWLGNNMSSEWNIWNVGNNDRWDRRLYDSPRDGVNAIFYALNNRYMEWYHTIDKLSRYGNKTGSIYSSSNYNWYKNMVKCLIMVKGTPIEEYYPFRWHESRTEVQEEAEEVVVKEVVKELTEEQIRLQKLDELYN